MCVRAEASARTVRVTRPRRSAATVLATALLSCTGCGRDTTEPRNVPVLIVNPARDTIPGTHKVRIDYVVDNRSELPVTVVTCEGFTMVTVERRTGGGWQPDAYYGCPQAPYTDVVVAPHDSHPGAFAVGIAGTYRAKVWRRPNEQSSESFIISPSFVVR